LEVDKNISTTLAAELAFLCEAEFAARGWPGR